LTDEMLCGNLTEMKKQEIEQALADLTQKLEIICEEQELEMRTIKFLGLQSDNLLKKSKDDSLPFNEKEEICKQMDALYNRMLMEEQMVMERGKRIEELDNRFDNLKKLIPEE
jgi:hypothetical protein